MNCNPDGYASRHLTFADILATNDGIGRGFGTLRLVASTAVFLAHSPWLVSRQFDFVYGFSRGQTFIGSIAVACFFIISGFLATESLQKSRSLISFAIKRALRIFPGLIVVIIFTALLIGPIATTLRLESYFTETQVYLYFANIIFVNRIQLPGVFDTHVVTAVNGSLWTLRYEMLFYAMLPLLAFSRSIRNRYAALVLTVVVMLLGYFASGDERVLLDFILSQFKLCRMSI